MSKKFRFLDNHHHTTTRGLGSGIMQILMIVMLAGLLVGTNTSSVSAAGTTYYVDNTNAACLDSGPGTQTAPFCTIQRGSDKAINPGDTVNVLHGTYAESVLAQHSGTAGNPIIFHGDTSVTLKGSTTGTGAGFAISTQSYIVIDGFNITQTRIQGIYVDASSYITITNNHVTYAGKDQGASAHAQGIFMRNTTYSTITGNTTDHNSCIGIRLGRSDYNLVSNNVSFGNTSTVAYPVVSVSDAAGIELSGSSHNTVINNMTYGNEDTGINVYIFTGTPVTASTYNLIIGNLSYGNGDHGTDTNNSPFNTFIGNTIQGNGTVGINFEGEAGTGSHDSTVMNNISVGNGFTPPTGSFGGNLRVDSDSTAGTVVDYDLLDRQSATSQINWNNVTYNSLAAFHSAVPAQEVHGLEGNALFVNPVPSVLRTDGNNYLIPVIVGDYHLRLGSPAIDSANAGAPNEPTLDIVGNARVDDPVVVNTGAGTRTYDDRGAYEYYDKAPTNMALSPSTVAENRPVNTVVGALSTTDPDIGDTFTYSLVSGTGSTDNTSFNISGSSLRTSVAFNYEAKTSYSIRVRSTDAWGLYFENVFAITVTNVNEASTDSALSVSTVPENQPVNTVVGALSTTDPDVGDTFTYSLVSGTGSTDNASFNISGSNLRTSAAFNYEARTSYSIRVRSTDAGGLYFDKVFAITVTNVNEAPTDMALSASPVAENQPVNTVVGTLSTTDPDAGDTFTYSLVSGTGSTDNTSFNISGSSLRTSVALDYEAKSSYSIRVRSADAGSLYFDKVFAITVTNVNETPTGVALSVSIVPENQPVNTVVGALSTTDPDIGDTFTYSLVSGDGSTDNASFNISGGRLRTSAAFDYEARTSYSIRVRSTDAGGLYFENVLSITVTNVDETPTDMALSASTVAENQPVNTIIGSLSSTDPDVGDTFTYSLVSGTGSSGNTAFNISGSSLRTAVALDYETKSSYSIRVRSTDAGGLYFDKVFAIMVIDINDPPVITQGVATQVNMSRNGAPKKFSLTLNASDQDGDTITWSIPSAAIHGTAQATGIGISKAIAYSPFTDYIGNDSFVVQVSDGNSGTNSITVNVTITATPGKPVLNPLTMQPKNGELLSSLTPTFTWGAPIPAADYYHLQISTSINFKTLAIDETNILGTSHTLTSALAPGLRYYWRVQGVNNAGAVGAWASTYNFRISLKSPVLLSPAADEALLTDRPAFNWQEVAGATHYTIQIASDSRFSKLLVNKIVTTPTFSLTSDLPNNQPFHWRILAKTSYVTSTWSQMGNFTTGNPPSVPLLLKPAKHMLTAYYSPLFDWSNSSVSSGVTFDHYWIQVASDDHFTAPVIDEKVFGILNSTFTPAINLASNTLFYWRVCSFSTAGHYSAWSAVRNFRTALLPPTLSSPSVSGTVSSLKPTFDWEVVDDASSYTIQVSRSDSFRILLLNKTVTGLTYTSTKVLPGGGVRLYWRVRANGVNGPSLWSTTWNFTTP